MKFDHLGIVVSDLPSGRQLLGETFSISRWIEEFEEPLQDVFVQFGRCPSGLCYELIAPRSPDSPVLRSLKQNINVINHVADLVESPEQATQRLAAQGFIPIDQPRPGSAFGSHPPQFLLAQTRLMVELIEARHHMHDFATSALYNPATPSYRGPIDG